MSSLPRVLADVAAERGRQLRKWGNQDHRTQHEYLSILTEEVGEVAREINEDSDLNAYRAELIQVAAVAVAAVEALDFQRIILAQKELN